MRPEEIEKLNKKTEEIAQKLDNKMVLTKGDLKILFTALILREEENESKKI